MTQFIIKTNKPGIQYSQPHFFVLNKGMNSGKPQNDSFTNSFAIIFKNKAEVDNYFWIAFALWKSQFWQQHLIGSVIPFVRLSDFKKEFITKSTQMMQEHEEHQKNIEALKLLEQQEKKFNQNINLINDLRKVILYRYCHK
ncbi:hypothetical protein SAMN05444143_10488 [Flavobacterium succinicans]|uniref:Uncharacterized protein n=1 Tax=Flavobacterium succinicans TaxID=29536 RepID=A0A1I4V1V0_9FLAO|nr:hypothetical protein [Flavobacterium succinicans]SFM95199.1 hypothetical protein SAMN05444143_10488 [Flavobacterium succinicans]